MRHLLWKIKNTILALLGQKTMGARALVISGDKILLVWHTYVRGWYTIGGAVDKGETPLEAMKRELFEEVGIKCTKPPRLFGVYYNDTYKRHDYVVLYVVEDIERDEQATSPEILKAEWISMSDLPKHVSPGTIRRIDEYLGKREISEKW